MSQDKASTFCQYKTTLLDVNWSKSMSYWRHILPSHGSGWINVLADKNKPREWGAALSRDMSLWNAAVAPEGWLN